MRMNFNCPFHDIALRDHTPFPGASKIFLTKFLTKSEQSRSQSPMALGIGYC